MWSMISEVDDPGAWYFAAENWHGVWVGVDIELSALVLDHLRASRLSVRWSRQMRLPNEGWSHGV